MSPTKTIPTREQLRVIRWNNFENLRVDLGDRVVFQTLEVSAQRKWQLKNQRGSFGDKVARDIEQRFRLNDGWMDIARLITS